MSKFIIFHDPAKNPVIFFADGTVEHTCPMCTGVLLSKQGEKEPCVGYQAGDVPICGKCDSDMTKMMQKYGEAKD